MDEVDRLIEQLKDEDGDVRESASNTLVGIGKPAVPALIEVLKDDDGKVRLGAALVLGEIGDASAIPTLIQALKDEDLDVRLQAAEAIADNGYSNELNMNDMLLQCFLMECILPYGERIQYTGYEEEAAVALIDLLRDKYAPIREKAADELGYIAEASPKDLPAKDAVPALIEALKDENRRVQRSAAVTLGKIGNPSAIPLLTEILEDKGEDDGARIAAAEALGEIKNPSYLPLLTGIFEDNGVNDDLRIAAAKAVDKQDPGKLDTSVLIEGLNNKNSNFRYTFADLLIKKIQECRSEIDLVKVRQSLKEFVDRVKEKGSVFKIREAKSEATKYYQKIASAVKEAKASVGMEGVQLEGSFRPKDRKDRMFRMMRANAENAQGRRSLNG